MFEHLDDPLPHAARATDRLAAAARGELLRRRRRAARLGVAATAGLTGLGVALVVPRDAPRQTVTVPPPVPAASGTAAPSPLVRVPGGTGPLPARTPREPVPACSPAERAALLPDGTAPPAGITVSARFGFVPGAKSTPDRGLLWYVAMRVVNTSDRTVEFTDQRPAVSAVVEDGRLVGGSYPDAVNTPSSARRSLAPGEALEVDVGVWARRCGVPRDEISPTQRLPFGSYQLAVGVRTSLGVWYAEPIDAWIAPDPAPYSCFGVPELPDRPPAPGLVLAAALTAPERLDALDPDAAVTAELRVTNTTDSTLSFREHPGARLAYLLDEDRVTGGWTPERAAEPVTHRVPPGGTVPIRVPVSSAGCAVDEPQSSGYSAARAVRVGLLVESAEGWYHWTVLAGDRVRYRS